MIEKHRHTKRKLRRKTPNAPKKDTSLVDLPNMMYVGLLAGKPPYNYTTVQDVDKENNYLKVNPFYSTPNIPKLM
jgi:hypothetical protein